MKPEQENNIPNYSSSYWREHEATREFPSLQEDIQVEAAVIGGGMAGILTTYFLTKEGVKVALLEGDVLLNGTTGHTTAKVTAQHSVMYDKLIKNEGEDTARLYYEAQVEAMNTIKSLISEHEINCDYKNQDAYLHAGTEYGKRQLEIEKKAYEQLDIPGELVYDSPLPFDTKAALKMPDQAHFHPVKFLQTLIDEIIKNGGLIFENTTAVNLKGNDDSIKVETRNNYSVTCDKAVMASHFPFDDTTGFYFSRLHPERSYAMAVKTEKEVPEGMYLGVDEPGFSLRHTEIGGEKLAIFGGENHKTGKSEDTLRHFNNIKAFADRHFGVQSVPYRWSAQDLITLDEVPYIGQAVSGKANIFVATGFKKWGMTNSMAAGLLLTDLITDKPNRFADLFAPTRSHLELKDGKSFIKENVDVASQFVKSHLERGSIELDELQKDEGAVVNIKGKRTGAYRNEKGELLLVDTTCTHMKCELEWNNGERSWDCPCHGSRFSVSGEVIEGPASEPLSRVNLE
ncbi:FAD-dependent oxidoreductase [Thalassobacillus sp. C254]|uniref:FAD-dependent oxidoreductase n=1 Tax=Thalassobacillus sp. C254 TaxID=1225341 RepID=UPI0006CFC6DE|nr:FAD-dependent oxidoreductase [Thalassobacillus sp. C254]